MEKVCMRRWVRIFFGSILLILLISTLTPLYISAEVVDKVVAVVNDEVITLSELNEETAALTRAIVKEHPEEPVRAVMNQARDLAMNGMIERRLIMQKAKKYNVTVTDEDVEAAYERMRNGLGLDPAEFKQKLENSGLSQESYKNKLKAQILQSRLLSYDVRSKIIVTDQMVLDYYNENYKAKVGNGGYYLLQMGFSWPKSDDQENLSEDKQKTRARAEEVYQMARNGEDFKSLAEKFSDLPSASDGGDIGVFTLDEMAPFMRDAVAELHAGELSQIVETPTGFQFFKLLTMQDEAAADKTAFDAVKEEIREKLFEEKLKVAYTTWVKKLKEEAYIQKL